MGLEAELRSALVPEQGMQIVDSRGTRRAFFPVNTSGKGGESFTSEFEIMRGDLCKIIYTATKDRAKYVFSTSIKAIRQSVEHVEVTFADGTQEQYDIVVGADGQNSRTRRMVFGEDGRDVGFQNLGDQYVAYFTIPRAMDMGEKHVATMYMTTKHRGIMTRRHSPHELQVYIGGSEPTKRFAAVARGAVQEEKEAIADMFEDAGWISKDIVAAMVGSDNFYCERLGLVQMTSWSKGRVVLVGDAAYCPSANTGRGTTCAIIGAYILVGEIGRHYGRGGEMQDTGNSPLDINSAFKAYEMCFQPYMTQVQEGLLESAERKSWLERFFASSPGITAMNYLLGAASFFGIDVVKMFLKGGAVTDWSLPEYEQLL